MKQWIDDGLRAAARLAVVFLGWWILMESAYRDNAGTHPALDGLPIMSFLVVGLTGAAVWWISATLLDAAGRAARGLWDRRRPGAAA